MAKDNRKILRAPRVGKVTFKEDDEDLLAALLTPEQGQRLIESGAISGNWEFTGTGEESEVKSTETVPVEHVRAELEKQAETFNNSWDALTQERDDLIVQRDDVAAERDALKSERNELLSNVEAESHRAEKAEKEVEDLKAKNQKLADDLKAAKAK